MNTGHRLAAILLCGTLLCGGLLSTQAATAAPPPRAPKSATTPGLEAARTLSMVTGVAISPLLGVGAVGAYQYYNTPQAHRARLAWYAQPWFWIPALLLVGLIGVKDILGTAAPSALKKPFDIAETIENKISGLIAAGAFLPLIISVFPEAAGGGPEALNLSPLGAPMFAAISAGSIGNALLIPFALAAFVVVWLASHAINILILISPFTTLDTALKALRLALLSLVAGTSFANPYIGAAIAAAVILVAYFIAGWSFRLTIMGTVFVWDFISLRSRRFQPGSERNKMFTATSINGAPVRTYGALVHNTSGAVFEYRPWLILPTRSFTLQPGDYVVGCGLLYPEICKKEPERLLSTFVLPPRYNGHEQALSRAYGFAGVEVVGIRKGLKTAWQWARGLAKGQARTEVSASVH